MLLRNDNDSGHWLEVGFEEFSPGAKVTVRLPDGRLLSCESRAGSSYLSSEDPRCHFGLGMADKVSELIIRWPNGSETHRKDLPADQYLIVSSDEVQSTTQMPPLIDLEEFAFQVMLKAGGAKPLEIVPSASAEMIELGDLDS